MLPVGGAEVLDSLVGVLAFAFGFGAGGVAFGGGGREVGPELGDLVAGGVELFSEAGVGGFGGGCALVCVVAVTLVLGGEVAGCVQVADGGLEFSIALLGGLAFVVEGLCGGRVFGDKGGVVVAELA